MNDVLKKEQKSSSNLFCCTVSFISLEIHVLSDSSLLRFMYYCQFQLIDVLYYEGKRRGSFLSFFFINFHHKTSFKNSLPTSTISLFHCSLCFLAGLSPATVTDWRLRMDLRRSHLPAASGGGSVMDRGWIKTEKRDNSCPTEIDSKPCGKNSAENHFIS